MKRVLGVLLALLLLCGQVLAPVALATADEVGDTGEESVVSVDAAAEDVEQETDDLKASAEVESTPDDEAVQESTGSVGTGLVVDDGANTADDVAESQQEVATTNAQTAPATATGCDYGRVAEGGADVYAQADAEAAFAKLSGGAVVLLSGERSGQRAQVVFDTDQGVVTAWLDADRLTTLTEEEKQEYLLSAPADAKAYEKDINALLVKVACTFLPTETQANTENTEGQNGNTENQNENTEGQNENTEGQSETTEGQNENTEGQSETTEGDQKGSYGLAVGEAQNFITPSFTEAQMMPGASRTIEVRDVSGALLSSPELTFSSSNEAVASVNAAGTVVARNAGTAVITATYAYMAAMNDTLQCEVKIQVLGLPGSIKASPGARTIGVGETYTGLRAVFPAGTGAAVRFTSSKPKVATVNATTGAVYGKKKGKTVITITTSNGKKAKCTITVVKAPSKVWLNAGSLTMALGGHTAQLRASVPKKTTGGVLKWISSNPDVATVNGSGVVTSVNPGTATITVKTYNGVGGKVRSASCRVTVTEAPARAYYNSTSFNVMLNGVATPGYTVLDANGKGAAGHPRFRIVSASPAGCVALNAGNGAVKGVKTGTAVIAFTTYNGIESENQVTVRVCAPVKKIKITGATTMAVGQQYSGWKIALSPAGAYNAVTYSSSKSSVLRVLNARTGLVQAMKKGTAYITVKSHNGKKSKIKVTVKAAPPKVSLSPANAVLKQGASGKYKVNLYGGSGSYTFTSSNPEVATISGNGTVLARALGTTTITVRTFNGKTASTTLSVQKQVVPGLPANLYSTTTSAGNSASQRLEYMIFMAQSKAGCKYVWGHGYTADVSQNTFDCSGFVYWCYRQIGITLKNSAYKQGYDDGYPKIGINDLKRGDVVCFNTDNDGDVSDHTGIYLGNGYFIHASSSGGKVMVSQFVSSSSNYYQRNFSWGRRILN